MDNENRYKLLEVISKLDGDELKVMLLLANKMLAGKNKYGSWVAKDDKRNYYKEASEELLDACNYLAMEIIKQS